MARKPVSAQYNSAAEQVLALVAQARAQRKENKDGAVARLFNAAGDGRLHLVRKYIEQQGMDVDTRNHGGYTALGYAASDGNMALVEYLIDRGADVNARTGEGLTPLSMAALKDNAEVFKRLLLAGANPRLRSKSGLSVRNLAALNNAHAVLAVLDDRVFMAGFGKGAKTRAPKA